MMTVLPSTSATLRRATAIASFTALISVISVAHAGQARSVSDRVYATAQAARGQVL